MYCHLQSCKKFGRSFQQIKRKYRKARKRTLNPLSSWIFLEKLSSSNNASYCHLQSCHKSRGCCRRFGEMTKKVKKHLFGHLIPCNPVLRIFSEKSSSSNCAPYCRRCLKPFSRKCKNTTRTDGMMYGRTDRGQFIGSTSKVGGSKKCIPQR